MTTPLRWRIYYGDGSTWSDQDGPPELGPPRNVQVIAFLVCPGRRGLIHGHERYWFIDNVPYGGSIEDLHDHLEADTARRLHGVKKGRTLDTPEWQAVFSTAHHDPDFPWPPER